MFIHHHLLSLVLPLHTGDVLSQALLCILYSCHLQINQQPGNLTRRFKVVSSFSIDFSASVHANCGGFKQNGETQRMGMLMCCCDMFFCIQLCRFKHNYCSYLLLALALPITSPCFPSVLFADE